MSSPAIFAELENPPVSTEEEQRALQIALELSNLGILGTGDDESSTSSSYEDAARNKKSQNMTECVPVPSSEHVAEIVGRQGCKIKALRAKTSTYIKTPVRGEEPVFVVTGRKEDVAMARREIQSAAEHFTQIRATRNKPGAHSSVTPLPGLAYPLSLPSNTASPDLTSPGTITLQVRVPYRVVGLVVGPKGATIKRIQQQTHTYIVTPSRDKEPVFEVTGLPENVEKAKEEIEAHIASRTGNQSRDTDDDFASNGTVVGSPASFSRSQSAFTPYRTSNLLGRTDLFSMPQLENHFLGQFPGYPSSKYQATTQPNLLGLSSSGAMSMYTHSGRNALDQYELGSGSLASTGLGYDVTCSATSWANGDLPEMSSFPLFSAPSDNTTNVSSMDQQMPLGTSILQSRLSPTFSDGDFPNSGPHPPTPNLSLPLSSISRPVQRVGSDSVDSTGSSLEGLKQSNGINIESGYSSSTTDSQTSGSPVDSAFTGIRSTSPLRVCLLCRENNIEAALVPCGHNRFCYECADKAAKSYGTCPCCHQMARMAMVIKS